MKVDSKANSRRSWVKSGLLMGAAVLALSACQMGAGDGEGGGPLAATSSTIVDRDVEAPEIFQTEDRALWDGRPSLGGVWVASPAAQDPERVILRNPANGKFVIGGLFRREAEMPGPSLQLSSDAAEALGLLAGEPATISVTALRREEVAVRDPDASTPLVDTAAALPAEEMVTATELDAAPEAGAAPPPPKPAASEATDVASEAMAAIASPEAPTAPAPTESGSLIQIGIFSVEANAKRAVSILDSVGISARMTQEQSQGKALWSVTTRGDKALLDKVKAAGFADAYVLKR